MFHRSAIWALVFLCMIGVPVYGRPAPTIIWVKDSFAEGHYARTSILAAFAAEVRAKSAGRTRLAFVAAPPEGARPAELLQFSIAAHEASMPLTTLAQMPAGGTSLCRANAGLMALIGPRQPLAKEFEAHGIHPLLLFLLPDYRLLLFVDRKLETVEDFKGLRVRTTNAAFDMAARALGMTPVRIDEADQIPEAVRAGRLDAALISYRGASDYGFEDLIKARVDGLAFGSVVIAYGVPQGTWRQWPVVRRRLLSDAAATAARRDCAAIGEAYRQAEEKADRGGVALVRLPQRDLQRARESLVQATLSQSKTLRQGPAVLWSMGRTVAAAR